MVAYAQSNVCMKNFANAFAPACVLANAATGYTGGCSPGFTLCPVRGTSAGTAGTESDGDGLAVGEDTTDPDEPVGLDTVDRFGFGLPPEHAETATTATPPIATNLANLKDQRMPTIMP